MKILVTGGAGFIGSNVVDGYIEAGHEVIDRIRMITAVIIDIIMVIHDGGPDQSVMTIIAMHPGHDRIHLTAASLINHLADRIYSAIVIVGVGTNIPVDTLTDDKSAQGSASVVPEDNFLNQER